MKSLRFFCVLSLFLLSSRQQLTLAEVRLPGFFTDHMVLQQQKELRIHGWADPDENIAVTLAGTTKHTNATTKGKWAVTFSALQGGKDPVTLTVVGSNNTIEIKDILIGEVWLCSGQSNMEWTVSRSTNAEKEIAAANYPLIRHIKIARKPNSMPQSDVEAEWQICSPETVGNFTACGYFMARKLYEELDVPVGLLNSSWGGTRVEPWTPPVGFKGVEALQDIYQSVIGRTPGTPEFREKLSEYIAANEEWLAKARNSLTAKGSLEPAPAYPAELTPFQSHQDPTMLYNGMIHALVGFRIAGAIWYQGESNHSEGMLYFEKKKALINGWRTLWGQNEFPFYYVQIAPFQYGNEDPTILAKFWEAQAAVEQLPDTGMVVINDIATLNDIHPPNKQDVGLRLANLALRNTYGKANIVASSPKYKSLEVIDGRLKVNFNNTAGGLKTRDGKAPSHFQIIGPGSGGFQDATARIDGDAILLISDSVKSPTAFRFAWHKLAEPNLTGGTGLPVGAFRGGEIPDFVDTLPIGKDYKLVYDLDLSKLGRTLKYDVDNSSTIGTFDRIAYLVELGQGGNDLKQIFVSMDAFTDDATKTGIPTAASQAHFQQGVNNLVVYSTIGGLTQESPVSTGNIEFWSGNYGPQNSANVQRASNGIYDFGDSPGPPDDGYGCMQVHNFASGKTLFAINHWNTGANADLGIGNSEGNTRDWTFTANAGTYEQKRLRVYVRSQN